jgi:mono/diheme cytochrome c family protein
MALLGWCDAAAGDAAERGFALDVLPLLKQKCQGCHGGDRDDIKGELSLLERADLLQGGESGEPAIVPGRTDQGTLLAAVRWDGLEMPPKESDRLTTAQIAAIERWVEAGAPWPDEQELARYRREAMAEGSRDDGVVVDTSGGLSDDWTFRRYQPEDLWAFAPVSPLSPGELTALSLDELADPADDAFGTAVIDALIAQQLDDVGLAAVGRADARTRIRRATFDLHGVPPTPEEVEAFVAASEVNADAAWDALIDRLLASPRYGERWGQHWLDVTRYADTGGMSNDFERSNMWRYRDYVIRALNSDKPYDRFIVEQIAGDELADESVRERTDGSEEEVHRVQQSGEYLEHEAEWIVATGFLRLGPWDNAMVEQEEARQIWLDDLVNITGQTFLATTLRCVKCHDHKFDPLPTRDYYRIYAAFATTQMAERTVPFLPEENQAGFEEGQAHAKQMLDFAVAEKTRLVEKREAAARNWFEEHDLPYQDDDARKSLPDEEKPPRHVGLDHVEQGQLKVREQDEWIWTRRLERYEPMAQSVYNAADFTLAWNGARKLRIKRDKKQPSEPRESFILLGGALGAPGEAVSPGVLSAVPVAANSNSSDPSLLTDAIAGRRLGLARWIADADNPLTTRGIVNRIWQGHFGTGLAANSNNFGAKGAKPSHPRLLDFLAADFVQHGWRIKRLHRMIMRTDAYQRGSSPPTAEVWTTVDPDNRLLSHFPRRRLSAEEIRDGVLLVTGELQDRQGGLPIMPEINQEVALEPRMIQFSIAPAYQPSRTPAVRNGRSVYAYRVRGQADPFAELFNQPSPNESCDMRESAAVTTQVFTLLNSDQMTDRSIAFAARLEAECETASAQIDRAFQLALGRGATAAELTRLVAYLAEMVAYHRDHPAEAVSFPTEITRSLVEEFSGEVFEYQEILPVFENYEADRKAAHVSPETRALADVCLLLLNMNEFLYVD